jgi:hypothetical protein
MLRRQIAARLGGRPKQFSHSLMAPELRGVQVDGAALHGFCFLFAAAAICLNTGAGDAIIPTNASSFFIACKGSLPCI